MKTHHWRRLAASGVVLLSLVPAGALAQTFQCTLADVETTSGGSEFAANTEQRQIQIQVDETGRRITIYQDGKEQTLGNVTITQIAMTGYTGMLSIGIQRSSLNVVLQTYEPKRSKAEFGICRNANNLQPK